MMEKTAVMTCVLLFISSLVFVDAMVRVPSGDHPKVFNSTSSSQVYLIKLCI